MNGIKLISGNPQVQTVAFCGKLTSENAEAFFEELTKIHQAHPESRLEFDFEQLEYISSAGLRVLMKMKKKQRDIKILNVRSTVMEVLDTTGFTEMFKVYKAMKRYDLSSMTKIGQGANGEVYRLNEDTVIKVFQPTVSFNDIEHERTFARQALIAGIPTAIPYETAKVIAPDGNIRYGIVFEFLEACMLSSVLQSCPEEYDAYVEKYIKLLQTIHQTKDVNNRFQSIKQIYYEALDTCREYYTPSEMNKLNYLLDSIPDRDTLIHGDYSPNNIMVQKGELCIIDMGNMSRGHAVFDFLATAATQVNLVKLNPEFAEKFHTKMPVALITQTWQRLMEGYFADYAPSKRDEINEQLSILCKLKVALAPYFGRGAGDEIITASIADGKANLLPYIDKLIGQIDW